MLEYCLSCLYGNSEWKTLKQSNVLNTAERSIAMASRLSVRLSVRDVEVP